MHSNHHYNVPSCPTSVTIDVSPDRTKRIDSQSSERKLDAENQSSVVWCDEIQYEAGAQDADVSPFFAHIPRPTRLQQDVNFSLVPSYQNCDPMDDSIGQSLSPTYTNRETGPIESCNMVHSSAWSSSQSHSSPQLMPSCAQSAHHRVLENEVSSDTLIEEDDMRAVEVEQEHGYTYAPSQYSHDAEQEQEQDSVDVAYTPRETLSTRSLSTLGQQESHLPPLGSSERLALEAELRARRLAHAKEEQERRVLSECSFRPRINPSEGGGHTGRGENSVTYFSPVWQRLARTEKITMPEGMVQQLEELSECTFRPQINKNSRRLAADYSASQSLYQRSLSVTVQKCDGSGSKKVGGTSEERECQEHCTFRPAINGSRRLRASSVSSSFVSFHGSPVNKSNDPSGRLEARVEAILRAKHEHVAQLRREQEQEFTFQPRINHPSKGLDQSTRKRGTSSHQTPQKSTLETRNGHTPEGLMSTPGSLHGYQSSTTSSPVSATKGRFEESGESSGSSPSHVRQYDDALHQKYQHDVRVHLIRVHEVMKPCTFQPKIDPVSRRMIEKNPLYRSKEGFEKRQQLFAARALSHRMDLLEQREIELRSQCVPPGKAISRVQKRIAPSTVWRHVERLYQSAPERTACVKEELQRLTTEHECPFKPQISERSRRLTKHRERGAYAEDTQSALVRGCPAAVPNEILLGSSNYAGEKGNTTMTGGDARQAALCFADSLRKVDKDKMRSDATQGSINRSVSTSSLKPKITQPLPAAEDFYDEQMRHSLTHVEYVNEMRRLKEQEEIAECTFHPETHPVPRDLLPRKKDQTADSVAPSVVSRQVAAIKGVDEYMQRISKAQREREELEERRRSIGRGLPCNGPRYTLTDPFDLRTAELSRSSRCEVTEGSGHRGTREIAVPSAKRSHSSPLSAIMQRTTQAVSMKRSMNRGKVT